MKLAELLLNENRPINFLKLDIVKRNKGYIHKSIANYLIDDTIRKNLETPSVRFKNVVPMHLALRGQCRKPVEEIAKELNPVIRGITNYYHKFWDGNMRIVWNQLNARLLKWEKDLYKIASVRYLKTKYKEKPNLFAHWLLVYL